MSQRGREIRKREERRWAKRRPEHEGKKEKGDRKRKESNSGWTGADLSWLAIRRTSRPWRLLPSGNLTSAKSSALRAPVGVKLPLTGPQGFSTSFFFSPLPQTELNDHAAISLFFIKAFYSRSELKKEKRQRQEENVCTSDLYRFLWSGRVTRYGVRCKMYNQYVNEGQFWAAS